MAFTSHRGTVGHAIGTSIIGKDQPAGTSKATQVKITDPGVEDPQDKNKPTGGQLHSIRMEKHANGGFSVSHTMKGEDGAGMTGKEESNVFTSAGDAHSHLGKLMDCPNCAQ
jgi:hypothetical protein